MHDPLRRRLFSTCVILGLATLGFLGSSSDLAPMDETDRVAGYEKVAHLLSYEDFATAPEVQRRMLVNVASTKAEDRLPAAPCWKTPVPWPIRNAFNQMIQGPGMEFVTTARWGSVATPGGSTVQGTPITLTYSFVPDGTTIPSGVGEPTAPSNLFATFNTLVPTWQALIHQSFAQWGANTGITYVHETTDDGAPLYNAIGALGVRGDIRISGKNVDGSAGPTLAFNSLPNGGGDMVLDTSETSFFSNSFGNFRRFRNVVMHEGGHGIGLLHVCPTNQSKLMEPLATTFIDGPQQDDILGGQRHYGDTFEPNDTIPIATDEGTYNNGTHVIGGGSIDDDSDTDYYKFTVTGNKKITVSVNPIGTTYFVGAETATCSSTSPSTTHNALAVHDLKAAIFDVNGTTMLVESDITGAGLGEAILNQHLISGAGTYYLRVKGSAANDVQRYSVILSISDSTLPVLALTGPCADGTVGILAPGGIEAVFTINFQTGGASHRVDLPQSSGIILNMAAPTTLPTGAPFVIFGKFGVALPSDLTPLPLFIGDMCFNVPPLAPLDPTLFILADNITTGAALLPSTAAPWFTLLPPIPLSLQVTLQGIILENAIDLRTTNAILLNIL